MNKTPIQLISNSDTRPIQVQPVSHGSEEPQIHLTYPPYNNDINLLRNPKHLKKNALDKDSFLSDNSSESERENNGHGRTLKMKNIPPFNQTQAKNGSRASSKSSRSSRTSSSVSSRRSSVSSRSSSSSSRHASSEDGLSGTESDVSMNGPKAGFFESSTFPHKPAGTESFIPTAQATQATQATNVKPNTGAGANTSATGAETGGISGFFKGIFGGGTKNTNAGANAGAGSNKKKQQYSSDSESSASSVHSLPRPKKPNGMEHTMRMKQDYLYKISNLEKRGYRSEKRYNINSSYEELHYEYHRLKKQRDADLGIKFLRKALVTTVHGIEMANSWWDPLDLQLDGWSESINENIEDYDEVLEELHHKYKSKVKLPPELRLMFMVGSSGLMFHLSNSMVRNRNMDGVGGGGGFMNNMFQNLTHGQRMNMNHMAQSHMGQYVGQMMREDDEEDAQARARGRGGQRESPVMRGPTGVDDLLQNLQNRQPQYQQYQQYQQHQQQQQQYQNNTDDSEAEEGEYEPRASELFKRPAIQTKIKQRNPSSS